MTRPRRVVILGAVGRDFHNFNVVYRDDPAFEIEPSPRPRFPASRALAVGADFMLLGPEHAMLTVARR